jgi:hypothetical protein
MRYDMKHQYLDYVGSKHGRLTILAFEKEAKKPIKFYCLCECGNTKYVSYSNISRTKSCGCYRIEHGKNTKTHGAAGKTGTRTKAYSIWTNMKSRCTNTNLNKYKYYGGRGITYCKEWNKFENFLKDMGNPNNGMTLDRINNNGNYEPLNCRWISMMDQAKNKTNTLWLNLDGNLIHLMEASRRYPIKMQTIWARIKKYGWTDKQAVGIDPKPPRKSKVNV